MNPHFRIVRFSPTPGLNEPVNVALLLVDDKARLVTDTEFQKLACIAPRFNVRLLRFMLDELGHELMRVDPEEAHTFLATRTAQLQVGEPQQFTRPLPRDFESKLIEAYLRRNQRPSRSTDRHMQYVDTLVDDALAKLAFDTSFLLNRARPKDFLSPQSVALLPAKSIKFSRVLSNDHKIVLMDGLNLAVASKPHLRQRAAELGYGFFSIGNVRSQLQAIEGKPIVRASFVFNRPPEADPEVEYSINLVERDADLKIDAATQANLGELKQTLVS